MKLWLYLKYQFFLGVCKLINRFFRLYLRLKGCRFDQVAKIGKHFELAEDQCFVALVTRYLIENLTYSDKDKPDFIKEPEHALFDVKNNCNDFSNCILGFIKHFKPWIDSSLMIVYAPEWRGHCIVVIHTREGIYHTSNWGVFPSKYETLEQLACTIHPEWSYFVIADEKLNLKQIQVR